MEISLEFAKDILITAVEGDVGYWATVREYSPDKGWVCLFNWDSGEEKIVTAEDVVKAVQKLFDEKAVASWVLEQFLDEDVDAVGADCAVQMAFFGEVIYG